jgi:hypothetical protein
MRYFYDTEFIEDGATIELVSIGVVAEDGREFYAVSSEFNEHRAGAWVRRHVLPQLPPRTDPVWLDRATLRDRLYSFLLPGHRQGGPGRGGGPARTVGVDRRLRPCGPRPAVGGHDPPAAGTAAVHP